MFKRMSDYQTFGLFDNEMDMTIVVDLENES